MALIVAAVKAGTLARLLRRACAVALVGGASLAFVVVVVLSPPPDPAAAVESELEAGAVPNGWASWVAKAGALCAEFPAPVIAAQIDAESGWNPRAVSPVGAQGLSQFMPGTWPVWGRDEDGNGSASPFDPGDAIMAQGRYDCALAGQLRGKVPGDLRSLALAAYNAGPGAVLGSGGIPPYPETQAYVAQIQTLTARYTAATATAEADTGEAATGQVGAVLAVARKYLGTPYAYGGGGPDGPGPGWYGGTVGWDCSSYMQYVFWQGAHVQLPRTAAQQASVGRAVSRAEMRPGDIVVFGSDLHHVGVYIGDGKMIDEPRTGSVARVDVIAGSSYWQSQPWTIRRIL